MSENAAPSLKADHICIGVDEVDAMLAWYCDKLGFVLEKRWNVEALPGMELAYVRHPSGFRIEMICGGKGPRSPSGRDFSEHLGVRGFNHLCFWTPDVDGILAVLVAKGVAAFVAAEDYPKGAERRVAFVRDPEGNVIEFAGPLNAPKGGNVPV